MNKSLFTSRNAVLFYISLFKLLLLIIFADNYGLFRDEYYYIECSKHLAWGFVDQPPLSPFILAISRLLFGDSILGIRIFAYLAGSAIVFMGGLLAREIGGNRFAEVVTAVTILFCGVILGTSGYFSMNAFDILFSTVFFYLLIKLVKTDNPKLWLAIGMICGIGLMNKLSFLFLGFGLFVGLILTPQRKYFKSKYLWLAAAIAFIIFLPNILWQVFNDFPTLEFMRNAAQYKNEPLSPTGFLIGAMMELNPGFTPIVLIGIYFLFFNKKGKAFSIIGWIFISVLLVFMFNNAKPYYMGILYPAILAAGAVELEKIVERFLTKRVWAYAVIIILLIPSFIVVTPFAIPALPVDDFITFQETIGIKPSSGERSKEGVLPQFFADRFGWEEMVQDVAKAYNKLSKKEKSQVIIIADNYGEAGAIDYYRKKYGLPKVISPHNNYWIWGNDTKFNADVYIILDITREEALKFFKEVEFGVSHHHPLGKPSENFDIYIGRKPKGKLSDIWNDIRNFI